MKKLIFILLLLCPLLISCYQGISTTQPPETTRPPETTAQPTEHVCAYTKTVIYPTCELLGYSTYECDCGSFFNAEYTPALGHAYSNWTTTIEPTCMTNGEKQCVCFRCGHTVSLPIDAIDHKFEEPYIERDSTCEESGFTQIKCAFCDATRVTETPALGHSFAGWTLTTAPTCTKDGQETNVCSGCSCEITRTVAKIGHQFQHTSTTQPTIVSEGYDIYTCSGCGAEYRTALPKLQIVDVDTCGESLIGKVLPNAPYPEFSNLVLDRWNKELSQQESFSAGLIKFPTQEENYRAALTAWKRAYRFMTDPFTYAVYIYGDGSVEFYNWASETSYSAQQAAYQRVYEILAELGINETVTKKEAVIRINNWICKQKYYNNDHEPKGNSVYHSLFAESGVCHNYAIAFQVLCLGAGIECHYVQSDAMNHAWNQVFFSDGSSLYVDVCWNDYSSTTNYLLISKEQLLKTHIL